jgi:hypothetical protein
MEQLLTTIVTWLSLNFGMPAILEHPRVELVPPERMHAVRGVPQEVEAVYDDASRTIFLDERWEGATPAQLSVLVHEMVHHLQNVGGRKFACPQAREAEAYAAQEQWLREYRRSLEQDFELDRITLLLRTRCMG